MKNQRRPSRPRSGERKGSRSRSSSRTISGRWPRHTRDGVIGGCSGLPLPATVSCGIYSQGDWIARRRKSLWRLLAETGLGPVTETPPPIKEHRTRVGAAFCVAVFAGVRQSLNQSQRAVEIPYPTNLESLRVQPQAVARRSSERIGKAYFGRCSLLPTEATGLSL